MLVKAMEVNDPDATTVMVWCGLVGGTVLGPHFLEGNMNQYSYSQVLDSTLLDWMAYHLTDLKIVVSTRWSCCSLTAQLFETI